MLVLLTLAMLKAIACISAPTLNTKTKVSFQNEVCFLTATNRGAEKLNRITAPFLSMNMPHAIAFSENTRNKRLTSGVNVFFTFKVKAP